MNTSLQRLMRSRNDRIIAGIAGGISNYLAVDPLISRIIFVFLLFSGGIGLVAYLLLWITMPNEPAMASFTYQTNSQRPSTSPLSKRQRDYKFGTILVSLGMSLIILKLIPWVYPYVLPVLLIGSGIMLFYRSK
jgi:phage shock protein C